MIRFSLQIISFLLYILDHFDKANRSQIIYPKTPIPYRYLNLFYNNTNSYRNTRREVVNLRQTILYTVYNHNLKNNKITPLLIEPCNC
jgi:hypothetical protein